MLVSNGRFNDTVYHFLISCGRRQILDRVRPGQDGSGHRDGGPTILIPTGDTGWCQRGPKVPFSIFPASVVLSDPVRVDAAMIVVFLVAPVVIIAGSLAIMSWRGRKRRLRGW